LTYLETVWNGVPAGVAAAKLFLWSGCRKLEIAGLKWDALRVVGGEYHFEIVGKWGIEKWFRIPEAVYQELLAFRTDSPFVFAAYIDQLRQLYAHSPNWLRIVGDGFTPKNFGRWLYLRIKDWSENSPKGRACVHVFRKTTLQYARRGEDINRQVASDARVTEGVLMTNYVKETDEEMRQRSNRTFRRILASLSPEVARRYGYQETPRSELEHRLRMATEAKDWPLAADLVARLAERHQSAAG
jgi:integrase